VGIWKAAEGNRRLQLAGGLLVGLGVMSLTVGQLSAMHLRGTEQGLAGTMHLVEGMVAMLMIFTAMGVAATTFGTRFRLYTIATIVLALGFGRGLVWKHRGSSRRPPESGSKSVSSGTDINCGSSCWLWGCCASWSVSTHRGACVGSGLVCIKAKNIHSL